MLTTLENDKGLDVQEEPYVYHNANTEAKVNDRVFWTYNPNLFGTIKRLEADTFTVHWHGKRRVKYPRHSWVAIGLLGNM